MPKFIERSVNRSAHDEDVRQNVEDALWRETLYRVRGRNSVDFEVRQGMVMLRGHVSSRMSRVQIADWVRIVPGVGLVVNDLVADADLEIEVAQALGDDLITRPHHIRVGAIKAGLIWLVKCRQSRCKPPQNRSRQAYHEPAGFLHFRVSQATSRSERAAGSSHCVARPYLTLMDLRAV
jgi:hypothetical protein